ncbi:MAG TPA: dienelactone hydrolase family protein [Usitatibacter sp.]|nr:dienelactone hydrolase family protein [Usitatibacter sp.]
MKRILLFGLLVATGALAADDTWILREGQHRQTFATKDATNMHGGLLLFLPKGFEHGKWPLIVFLHGRGQVGDDPEILRKGGGLPKLVEVKPDFPFIVASPQLVKAASNFDPAALNDFLEQLLARLPMVDLDRVYVSGLSMGAKAGLDWAATSPDRMVALLPVANRIEADRACALKSVPIWAFHNDKDPVVPVSEVRKLTAAVQACGGSMKLTVFPDRPAHDAWNRAYATPEVYEWLLSHRRK